MAKSSSKEIISLVKKKEASEKKVNITFRLNESLIFEFKEKCQKEGVSMASVIEQLLTEFTKN